MKTLTNKYVLFAVLLLFISLITNAQEIYVYKGKIPSSADYYRYSVIIDGEQTTNAQTKTVQQINNDVQQTQNTQQPIDGDDNNAQSEQAFKSFEYPFKSGESSSINTTIKNYNIDNSNDDASFQAIDDRKNSVVQNPPPVQY